MGAGGAYNRILTAFTAAAGGNATGGATQLVQAAAIGYLQGLGAQQVKALADGLESHGQPNATSEAVRTALQALVGCAGTQAATGSCSAGAMGAAASVVLNDALDAAQGVSGESLSASDKQNRQNLVGSLVAGIAAQAGVNANAASGSAQVETGNNALLTLPEPTPMGFVPLPVGTLGAIPGQQQPSVEDQLLHPYGKPDQSGLNDNTGTTLPGWVSSVGDFLTSLPSEAGSALQKLVNTPIITPSACALSVMFCGATAILSSSNEGGSATNTGLGSDVNLASPDRTDHILNGDATGGGHFWPGAPGKSAFPESWSASKVMNAVSDIATDPTIAETAQANGRIVKNGTVDGVNIRVVIEPPSKGGGIVTAFPTNVPRTPR